MSYLIFRSVATTTNPDNYGGYATSQLSNTYVAKVPSHKKAAMRNTEYYVKGRDGALHVNEGFKNFNLKATLVLVNGGVEDRYRVNAWADGTGKLILCDDLTRAYKATVFEEIVWRRVKAQSFVPQFSESETYVIGDYCKHNGSYFKFIHNHTGAWDDEDVQLTLFEINGLYDTAEITFNCQPFLYESLDSYYTITSSNSPYTLYNPGTEKAFPMIQINGSGDVSFSINDDTIQISDVASGMPVYIDCENGYVYTSEGATTMTGEIPELVTGNNTITIGTGVTSLVITPHWRWI